MSTCKTCGAPIRWARTDTGKAIPVDPEPRADGNITLVDVGTHLAARVGAAGSGQHVSHFVTCPQANGHRKSKSR